MNPIHDAWNGKLPDLAWCSKLYANPIECAKANTSCWKYVYVSTQWMFQRSLPPPPEPTVAPSRASPTASFTLFTCHLSPCSLCSALSLSRSRPKIQRVRGLKIVLKSSSTEGYVKRLVDPLTQVMTGPTSIIEIIQVMV